MRSFAKKKLSRSFRIYSTRGQLYNLNNLLLALLVESGKALRRLIGYAGSSKPSLVMQLCDRNPNLVS